MTSAIVKNNKSFFAVTIKYYCHTCHTSIDIIQNTLYLEYQPVNCVCVCVNSWMNSVKKRYFLQIANLRVFGSCYGLRYSVLIEPQLSIPSEICITLVWGNLVTMLLLLCKA